MAQQTENDKSDIEQAGDDLFSYAVDREDVKWLLARLHPEAGLNRGRVEYELQILKIFTVGWAVTYCLAASPRKEPLANHFWRAVYDFSSSLSETTGLMIGQDIDYFQVLKQRLDGYVAAMSDNTETTEPARVVGPVFAANCGSPDDLSAFMTGSKMFLAVVERVRQYLGTLGWF